MATHHLPLCNVFVLRALFQQLQDGDLCHHVELLPGLPELMLHLVADLLIALQGNSGPIDGFVEFRKFREIRRAETVASVSSFTNKFGQD